MGEAEQQEPTAANISCSIGGQLKDLFTPDHFFCIALFSWGGGGGAGEKGTHVVKWEMRVYLSPVFCVVGVFVRWKMYFTFIRVAVLALSCGGACMFTSIRVGAVLAFSWGWACMLTYIRLGAAVRGRAEIK